MPKYTVYLDDQADREIRAVAKSTGNSFNEVIRKRIQSSTSNLRFEILEDKLDALFALFELIVGDIGYIAGATRAGTKNLEVASKEGGYYEAQFRRTVAAVKRIFERNREQERGTL
jgi:hypothetical protein